MKHRFHKIYILFLAVLYINSRSGHAQVQLDSVTVPASKKYENATVLRKLFIGRNYRKEWSTPVKLPVFRLEKLRGGFTIVDSGGGRQTNNLRLKDKRGKEWTLRSVDKDIEKSMIRGLRNTMAETLMQDLQSAIHPYAALTVPVLAEALGIIVAEPRIYFIPDDPAFGQFRQIFANTVCLLEEREPTPDHSETKTTGKVLDKVAHETDHRLLQKTILKARLLDMVIADWDRHEDQWRWGIHDSLGTKYYYPIPRDRDFVYFSSDGLFLQFASRFFLPHMKGFSKRPSGLRRLNAKIIDLDLQWLNEMDAEDWKSAIRTIQQKLSDSIIYKAVRKVPREIYAFSGEKIAQKMISRRNALMKHAMRYYDVLAIHPVVDGTDENETFRISSDSSGISVSIYEMDENKKSTTVYHRKFIPRDTKKISMRGFGGNDQFNVDSDVSSSIKLYLEGGDGDDRYFVAGKIKARIFDSKKATAKSALAQN